MERDLAASYKLTRSMSEVLAMLVSSELVRIDELNDKVGSAKVAVHRLKQAVAPYGIVIKSKRTVGYWIDDETRTKIQQQVARLN